MCTINGHTCVTYSSPQYSYSTLNSYAKYMLQMALGLHHEVMQDAVYAAIDRGLVIHLDYILAPRELGRTAPPGGVQWGGLPHLGPCCPGVVNG